LFDLRDFNEALWLCNPFLDIIF
jgi:hypothetical protein